MSLPPPLRKKTAYLNGVFLSPEAASVSVLDRGFLFGDGAYEVIPVFNRKPFCLALHLERLSRSLTAIQLEAPCSGDFWEPIIQHLIDQHASSEQSIYLQITRGPAEKRDHVFPKAPTPTLFAMSSDMPPPPAGALVDGISAITAKDERWLHCGIKSISLLGNLLAKQAAVEKGAGECILIRDGFLTEGASSNVWVARNGELLAPPNDHNLLQGIRYQLMPRLCQEAEIPLAIRPILREELFLAEELLLSGAIRGLVPVTRLDGEKICTGKPGPVFRALHAAYESLKRKTVCHLP